MVVDHELAWLKLKEVVLSKASHGQRDLLKVMAVIEIDCQLPEGEQGYDGRPMPLRSSEPSSKPAEPVPAGDELMATR